MQGSEDTESDRIAIESHVGQHGLSIRHRGAGVVPARHVQIHAQDEGLSDRNDILVESRHQGGVRLVPTYACVRPGGTCNGCSQSGTQRQGREADAPATCYVSLTMAHTSFSSFSLTI